MPTLLQRASINISKTLRILNDLSSLLGIFKDHLRFSLGKDKYPVTLQLSIKKKY